MESGRGCCRKGPCQAAPVAEDAERGQGLALGDEVLGEGRAPGVADVRQCGPRPGSMNATSAGVSVKKRIS